MRYINEYFHYFHFKVYNRMFYRIQRTLDSLSVIESRTSLRFTIVPVDYIRYDQLLSNYFLFRKYE